MIARAHPAGEYDEGGASPLLDPDDGEVLIESTNIVRGCSRPATWLFLLLRRSRGLMA